jgi:hypothetical protein
MPEPDPRNPCRRSPGMTLLDALVHCEHIASAGAR